TDQPCYLLSMLKRQTVVELFKKIKLLQYWLLKQPGLSHLDLLAKIHPSLANHYQAVLEQKIGPIARFEQASGTEYHCQQVGHIKRYTSTLLMPEYLRVQGRPLDSKLHPDMEWQQDLTQAKKELEDLSVNEENLLLARDQFLRGNLKALEELPRVFAQEQVLA